MTGAGAGAVVADVRPAGSVFLSGSARARRRARLAALLVGSLYLSLHLCLGAWLAVPAAILDWTPRVVVSGSMAPALRPGDIVMTAAPPPGRLAVGALVVVPDPDGDGTVVHRVAAVEGDRYRTKGDANHAVDARSVPIDSVVAIGRMRIPMLGSPARWWSGSDHARLVAWVVSVVGATAFARRPRAARRAVGSRRGDVS